MSVSATTQKLKMENAVAKTNRQASPDWIYFLPILHFCACLMSMMGYLVPGLQYLHIVWDFIMQADLPVSLVAVALAPNYNSLATLWIIIAGTLWWYALSRAAEFLFNRYFHRRKIAS
jgi:hypothetical protein